MTVTVAMPYYACPDEVDRAVRSVLRQTHRDLVLVVVGDGEEPPLGKIRDSRLVVFTLPANHGAYFAQQLVIEASPNPWYAVIGADDWVEADHLEHLLALGHSANAPGVVRIHMTDGSTLDQKWRWEVGVFAVDRLRAIGGYDPAERVEQDALVMRLLQFTGGVARSNRITYHQVKRHGSLTMHPATGLRSVYRKERRRQARRVMTAAQRYRWNQPRIRHYREALTEPAVRAQLAEHVDQLRAVL